MSATATVKGLGGFGGTLLVARVRTLHGVLAGHTYAYRDRPLDAALDELQSLGLGAVEVWLGHAREGTDAVARALRERGLAAVAVSAGGIYDLGSDIAPRALELAEVIGAAIVATTVLPELVPETAAAAAGRATLCVENHWDQPLASPREVRRALEPHPDVGACLDTGHAIMAGVSAERFAAALDARLLHVHLKEARFPRPVERVLPRRVRRRVLGRPDAVFPGDGRLDVGRFAAALGALGYRGAVTVEHEGADATRALARLVALWRAATT
jgi:sugar phosphate isomerase/epimerase